MSEEKKIALLSAVSENKDAVIPVNQLQQASLEELIKYAMYPETKSNLGKSWYLNGALGLAAILSAWMYIVPSIKAGQREGGDTEAVLQAIGNSFGSALVVLNVGDYYVDLLTNTQDSLKFLRERGIINQKRYNETNCLLNKLQSCWSKTREIKLDILVLASLSVVPMVAASLAYRDWDGEPDALMALKAFVTFVVNAVSHTLPIKFILEEQWLNALLVKTPLFPFTVLKYLGSKTIYLCENNEKKIADKHAELISRSISIREDLAIQFKRKFIGQMFGLTESGKKAFNKTIPVLRYTPKLPVDFRAKLERARSSQSSDEAVRLFIEIMNFYNPPEQKHEEPTNLKIFLSWTNFLLRETFGVAGAFIVGASISGFLKSTFGMLAVLTGGKYLAGGLEIPTGLVTETLTMYFGRRGFQRIYDAIISTITLNPEIPFAFKLNFFASSFFIGITYFLAYFGYGTAVELIDANFKPEDWPKLFIDILLFCGKYGIIIYGAENFTELLDKAIIPFTKRFGKQFQQELVFIIEMLQRLAGIIDRMDPQALQKVLNNTKNPELLNKLGLKEIKTQVFVEGQEEKIVLLESSVEKFQEEQKKLSMEIEALAQLSSVSQQGLRQESQLLEVKEDAAPNCFSRLFLRLGFFGVESQVPDTVPLLQNAPANSI